MGLEGAAQQHTRVNAAVFQITTEDELVVLSNTGGRTTYQNAGRTLRRGFELGIESQLSEHWTTTLAYTRLQATYDSDFSQRQRPWTKATTCPACRRPRCLPK
jgi:iron complex outermembrane recepter protein